MHYGYDEKGYVRAIWATAPEPREQGALQVLEVPHENAPTDGYWRVDNGMLIEVPGTFDQYERRKARMAARRAERVNPDLIRRLDPGDR